MDNQKIIISLLVIIIILLVVCVIMISPITTKEESNLTIENKKLNEGDSLTVTLTNSHGEAIANAAVNIIITDEDGTTDKKNITTNDDGEVKFMMDEKGKYSVSCKYDGNDQYASSSTAGNITVKKVKTESISQESSTTTDYSTSDDEWVYGTGAGAVDDPMIHWRKNTRTGYAEYYNERTGESWGGYNIA